MTKPNRTCLNPNCKKEYYCCIPCEKINSWKRICCSPSCFQDYIKFLEERDNNHEG